MGTRPEFIGFKTLCTLILTAVCLSACASRQPDATQARISTMEQQISRNEEVISDLSQRLSVMQFMVDSHERMLRNPASPAAASAPPAQQPVVTKPPAASSSPAAVPEDIKDPNRLYEKAFATMQSRDYEKAAILFDELATRFPDHSLADNALYWLAECHYARRDYRKAITAFEEVPKRYPQGGKVPDAMLKNAYSRIQIGDRENAREILRQLIREYPFTDAASKAEARLKNLF
ncbi:Beta-barrel assembly machine subunit BamD [Desulfobotulus alkaliphilus]|uniref:Beta-barrel assembly machine subunit BamD n=1 Tax=Desulfobotulus alkaliphilus TaxID=622671 RepID=A0A562S7X2_9BACT|nr:tol-pal system protein YbgF [Desulfobotulus alkaliphilus]TWI77479.1 Beta-barrel assembly machine subunit BamD [Desulfobotulus alkaliphilus]